MVLTVEEYNALCGHHCPFCESTNIEAYPVEADDNVVYRDNICNDCKQGWVEYFTVAEIEPFDINDWTVY